MADPSQERNAVSELQITVGARTVLSATVTQGRVTRRTGRKVFVEDALVTGTLRLRAPVPCRLEAPGPRIVTMTYGSPSSPLFNAVYSPDDDIAVRFPEGRVSIDGDRFTLHGKRCAIEVLPDHYKRTVNPLYRRHDKKRFPRPPVGWLSWYAFFGEFDEKKMLKIADFAAEHFKKYGFEVVQIENWQKRSSRSPVGLYFHSLECDPAKFPHGMKHAADQIRARGFKAGLWVVPWGTGDEAVFRRDPDNFLVDRRGRPIRSWSGDFTLDPTHPKSKEWYRNLLRTVAQTWGYEYVKIDGLEYERSVAQSRYLYMLLRKRSVINAFHRKEADPLRNIARLIRRTIGPGTFFVVCAGDPTPRGRFMGVGNAARMGSDVIRESEAPKWNAVINTGRVSLRHYHLHNMAWYNDPDVLCIRRPLTQEHARMQCSMMGLTGQHLVLGDILYELPPDRVRMLQRIMPVCDTYPANLARNERLQPIWNLIIRRPFEQWNVVGLFNWNETKNINLTLRATDLGLNPNTDYLLFDFWRGTFPGMLRGSRTFRLRRQSCRLLSVRAKTGRPQLLSVDRHVTQGGVCVKNLAWNDGSLTLHAELDLPRSEWFNLALFVPKPFRLAETRGQAAVAWFGRETVMLRVRNGRWQCRFERPRAGP